jgi:hypothetical protein
MINQLAIGTDGARDLSSLRRYPRRAAREYIPSCGKGLMAGLDFLSFITSQFWKNKQWSDGTTLRARTGTFTLFRPLNAAHLGRIIRLKFQFAAEFENRQDASCCKIQDECDTGWWTFAKTALYSVDTIC